MGCAMTAIPNEGVDCRGVQNIRLTCQPARLTPDLLALCGPLS